MNMKVTSQSRAARNEEEAAAPPFLLLSVLRAEAIGNLQDFLAWHRSLGVTQFAFILHADVHDKVPVGLDAPDVRIVRRISGACSEARTCAELDAAARRHQGRWCVFVEPGEFLILPAQSLHETVAVMEQMGIDDLPAWRTSATTPADRLAYPLCRIGSGFRYRSGNRLPSNGRSVAHLPLRAALLRVDGVGHEDRDIGDALSAMRQDLLAAGRLVTPSARDAAWVKELANARERVLTRRIRICFISFEISEARHVGGIATAMTSLAKLLAAQGFMLDIIYCPWSDTSELDPAWIDHYQAFGITLHYCPLDVSRDGVPAFRLRLMKMVEELGPLDVIHIHEAQGYAAWFLERRLLQDENPTPTIVQTLHGGTRWHHEPNGTRWKEQDYLRELGAIRMCDMAISPSRYMLDWYRRHGAKAPNTCVLPNVLAPEGKTFAARDEMVALPRAIAFFGRLEQRKGIHLFIEALSLFAKKTDARPEVLFIGGFGLGYSREDLESAMAGVPLDFTVITNATPQGAMDLLIRHDAIAVAPSRRENAPYVVYECAEAQVPLLTTAPGGTPEILAESIRSGVIVPPDAAVIADRLAAAFSQGATRARLAFPALGVEVEHAKLWESLSLLKTREKNPPITVERVAWREGIGLPSGDAGRLICLDPPASGLRDSELEDLAALLLRSGYDMLLVNAAFIGKDAGYPDALAILESEPDRWADIMPHLPVIAPSETLERLVIDDAGTAEEAYRSLLRGASQAGLRVLCPAVHQLSLAGPPRLAQPEKPEARINLAPASTAPNDHDYMRCALLSREPFVALSMFTPACPWGSLPFAPSAERSLHLVHFDYSVLRQVPDISRKLSEARERWPLARAVVLASDDAELHALRAGGVDAIVGNLGMFSDETVFTPAPSAGAGQAPLYVAPMISGKRHDLAVRLPRIDLICWGYPNMVDCGPAVRKALTNAAFLNENPSGSGFSLLPDERLAQKMREASAGVFLSTEDGCCPEAVQFLLCGVPVVSVENNGGRDHFLSPPFAIEVTADADEVLRGYLQLIESAPAAGDIRSAALARIETARSAFCREVMDISRHWFGVELSVPLEAMKGVVLHYRRFSSVMTPPGEAPNMAAG